MQALEGVGDACVGYLQERVVVVSHQGVGEQGELEALADGGQAGKEVAAVVAA